jgi:tetratricopeptide (TPR) repeat protein
MTTRQAVEDERRALLNALGQAPDDPELLVRLGGVEYAAGRVDEAEIAFRRAVEVGRSPASLEGLSAVLISKKRFADALPYLEEAIRRHPGRPSAWLRAGEALRKLGRFEEAIAAFARAAQLQPQSAQAHYNLGLALRLAGRWPQGAKALKAAVSLEPDHAEAGHALGRVLYDMGRYLEAADRFGKVVRLRPEDPAAHASLGAAWQMVGDIEAARVSYEKSVALAPGYADGHSNLGTAYQRLRDPARAKACFQRALEIDPAHDGALAGLAATLDREGLYEEALALVEERLKDGATDLLITGVRILRNLGRSEEAYELLESAARRPGLSYSDIQLLRMDLGAVSDDLGRHEEAFAHYRAGNAAKQVRFDRAEYRGYVERLLKVFAPHSWSVMARADNPSELPVLVVGMPRSGTTLVEQILASHPGVAGAGELVDLQDAATDLGRVGELEFPEGLTRATAGQLEETAERYLRRLRSESADAVRVIDKTPANHILVGLLQQLYPRARVIHCVRHPLDTALSNYFQNFAGQTLPFSYDLEDIAAYYNGYLHVMEHWRQHAQIAMFEVVYEELVTDQERVSRELVSFLDLDWDPACLRFHRLDRLVSTASHAQVRRPMYRSSLGRWEPYRAWLEPLVSAIDWDAWRRSGFADRVDAAIALAKAET